MGNYQPIWPFWPANSHPCYHGPAVRYCAGRIDSPDGGLGGTPRDFLVDGGCLVIGDPFANRPAISGCKSSVTYDEIRCGLLTWRSHSCSQKCMVVPLPMLMSYRLTYTEMVAWGNSAIFGSQAGMNVKRVAEYTATPSSALTEA